MAQYDHLPLRQVGDLVERHKPRRFPPPPERDQPIHGAALVEQAKAIVDVIAREPLADGQIASIVLKADTPGYTTDEEWSRNGMTVLAHEGGQAVILFSSDAQLQRFRERAGAYVAGPAPESDQVGPPHAGFFDAIDGLSLITPQDRIGNTLETLGVTSPATFVDEDDYILDVEIWRPEDDFVGVYLRRVVSVIEENGGTVESEYHGATGLLVRVSAKGRVFQLLCEMREVSRIDAPPSPDLVQTSELSATMADVGLIVPPAQDAICIGIVDSGINNGHPLLENVVSGAFGIGDLGADDEKGHGTQVAGIAAYGNVESRLALGRFDARFKIASARVVNELGKFDDQKLAPTIVKEAIETLHRDHGCRIINMSLGDCARLTDNRACLWAEALDELARELDILIVVSAGNNSKRHLLDTYGDGIGDAFPEYLNAELNRVCVPAGAINVLTVGALAHCNGLLDQEELYVRPISSRNLPAPMTRSGPGISGAFKPDLVDYGGTAVFDGFAQDLADGSRRDVAGMTTLNHNYVEHPFASASGTSMAAPLVAYKAASILERFPGASANFIKALLALSARLPSECCELFEHENRAPARTVLGYGAADIERSIFSDDNRVILTFEGQLAQDKFAVFELPIPELFQTTAGEKTISVSLALSPPVRRTRLDYAGARMEFELVRGKTEEEVVEAFRKLKPREDRPVELEGRHVCEFEPKKTLRKSGMMQKGVFSRTRDISEYGDTYHLVVRHAGGWSPEPQGFVVAVMLEHSVQIEIYNQIRERVRVQERVQ